MRTYNFTNLADLATTDQHKEKLVEMLSAFDAFCKENGLRYYLSGGTLLGAIRHKGIIPWDDDIDINMPRPDCEKMQELAGNRIGKYELMAPNYEKAYHAYHWKLYDDSILVGKRMGNSGKLGKKVYPIFMDIFPIDGLPDTEEGNIEHYKQIIYRKKWANLNWAKRNPYRNPIKKLKRAILTFIAKRKGVETCFNAVIDHAKSIPFEEAEYIGVMMTNVHTTEERVKKSEYLPVVEVEFEGKMFPAPANYDTYLRQLYGDKYMELPPVHKRITRHALIPFISVLEGEGVFTGVKETSPADDEDWNPEDDEEE